MTENQLFVSKAIAYVKENADQPDISIADVSKHAGFSMDYFNRLFLAHTGFTVMAYVGYVRTQKAAKLLRLTDQSILDIALAVGYDSHEGFLKAFKKYYGMTPHDYRVQKKNQILSWGEIADKTVSARFIHENSGFQLVDPDLAIDFLLGKDAKRYGRFCSSIQNMGLAVALPKGSTLDEGFISVGDNGKGGVHLELWTDQLDLLSAWIHRFPEATSFYTNLVPSYVQSKLKENGIEKGLMDTPQSLYTGDLIPCEMPADLCIRPLSYADREHIVKWASGRVDGYIKHLLREKDYLDASMLEYGVFKGGDLIAIAGCGVDEVQGLKINDCCQIRFAKGKESDAEYRLIFSYVVNDLLSKGILPYDELQHGEYARSHGNFTAADMGFEIINWRYSFLG